MVVAQSQIYTLSQIDEWRVYQKGVPRNDWDKYTSTSYDFDKWISINDETFFNAVKWLNKNGNELKIGYLNPFHFTDTGILPSRNNPSIVYLNDGVLINMMPRRRDAGGDLEYVISPESPHFREEKLLDNIDLILFSQTRENLEKVASELKLPLFEMVSWE